MLQYYFQYSGNSKSCKSDNEFDIMLDTFKSILLNRKGEYIFVKSKEHLIFLQPNYQRANEGENKDNSRRCLCPAYRLFP